MLRISGIFVGGIFAASLSSVSSGVNALASVFYVDIVALIKEDIPDAKGAKYINCLGSVFESHTRSVCETEYFRKKVHNLCRLNPKNNTMLELCVKKTKFASWFITFPTSNCA